MKLSAGLKAYAEKRLGVASGARDAVYKAALAKAVSSGRMTPAQFSQLEKGAPPPAARPAARPAAKPAPAGLSQRDVDAAVEKALAAAGVSPARDVTAEALFARSTRVRVREAADRYSRA